EIGKVRGNLFQISECKKEPLNLPEPDGPMMTLSEKVYVPVKEHPDFNFVGRILGPRGMTAKQLEQETGCKIMVRGRGSMRDKKKENYLCFFSRAKNSENFPASISLGVVADDDDDGGGTKASIVEANVFFLKL
ncbi:unnamed protein product, partial [Notodromas monacha]